jgi:hypothetical protein
MSETLKTRVDKLKEELRSNQDKRNQNNLSTNPSDTQGSEKMSDTMFAGFLSQLNSIKDITPNSTEAQFINKIKAKLELIQKGHSDLRLPPIDYVEAAGEKLFSITQKCKKIDEDAGKTPPEKILIRKLSAITKVFSQ